MHVTKWCLSEACKLDSTFENQLITHTEAEKLKQGERDTHSHTERYTHTER